MTHYKMTVIDWLPLADWYLGTHTCTVIAIMLSVPEHDVSIIVNMTIRNVLNTVTDILLSIRKSELSRFSSVYCYYVVC